MTRSELANIIDNPLSTPQQRADAMALLDKFADPTEDADKMLAGVRRKCLENLIAANDTTKIFDLRHNWPDYEKTGKVLGEL